MSEEEATAEGTPAATEETAAADAPAPVADVDAAEPTTSADEKKVEEEAKPATVDGADAAPAKSTEAEEKKAAVVRAAAAGASEPKPGVVVSSSLLPETCLAAVLNFLPYSDVRRCMSAGKTMAVEAASQVETLNIMNPSELVGPAARRFANASELNILCLVSTALNNNQTDLVQTLSMTTAARTTPFMTIFPKLKSAFVGGVRSIDGPVDEFDGPDNRPHLHSYSWYRCRESSDHVAVFRVLVESLCGAFQAKMLSADLVIKGLHFHGQLDCKCEHPLNFLERPRTHCHFCRSIIASFPLRDVLLGISSETFCPSIVACLDALLKRSDGATALQTDEGRKLIARLLNRQFRTHDVFQEQHPEFSRRVINEGATYLVGGTYHLLEVHYLSPYQFPVVKGIIEAISTETLRSIPNALFSGIIFKQLSSEGKSIVLQDTMDILIDLGFNLNPEDYVLVDLHKEPALTDLKTRDQMMQQRADGLRG